ncbi:GL15003 [Drosophila persimilis]|uniref:GL15003 n=1 Tax=Drosophila persimilis TaxID=7234 RepID=B4H0L2_DROPE|nr:GL15003 [Drosophila persimilis]
MCLQQLPQKQQQQQQQKHQQYKPPKWFLSDQSCHLFGLLFGSVKWQRLCLAFAFAVASAAEWGRSGVPVRVRCVGVATTLCRQRPETEPKKMMKA